MSQKRAAIGFKGMALAPVTANTMESYVSGTATELRHAGSLSRTQKEQSTDLYYDDDLYAQIKTVAGEDVEIRAAEVPLERMAALGLGVFDAETQTLEADFSVTGREYALRFVVDTVSGLKLLDERERAISESYERRMAREALAAESEGLLVRGNQAELLKLIADFAPEYDDTGRTLGERLAAGFADGASGVIAWFEAFNGKLTSAREDMKALLGGGAGAAQSGSGGVSVNQTNVFNLPVESPGDTARRVARANQALGEAILAGL